MGDSWRFSDRVYPMLGLSLWLWILTFATGLVASTVTTVTGIGAGLIIYGILSFFLELKVIIPLTAPAQFLSNCLRLWVFRRAIHWRLPWISRELFGRLVLGMLIVFGVKFLLW